MIRKMIKEDIPFVQIIDKLCFQTENIRRFELMEAFVDEKASLVYECDGKIAGYIFNHILGSFAWFGTLGVHTDFRSENIGKQLVNETINIFHKEYNVKNIGLVTMPYSSYNIGFYLNLGFKAEKLALRLTKRLENLPVNKTSPSEYEVKFIDIDNKTDFENLLTLCKNISNELYEGLDMSAELYLVKQSKMGTGFIVYKSLEAIGFGVLRNKTVFAEEVANPSIRLLCLKLSASPYESAIDQVLSSVYEYCSKKDYQQLSIEINTADSNICSYLLKNHGFKIDKPSVSLIMGDDDFYSDINGLMLFKTVT
jgi:ribosomal protein S18 acetylase RimI-like enzyme